MKNLFALVVLTALFAGSVLAEGVDEQQRQIEAQNKAATDKAMDYMDTQDANRTMPAMRPQNEVTVQDGRDMVGNPLDDTQKDASTIGSDHIIEMDDSMQPVPQETLGVDGR